METVEALVLEVAALQQQLDMVMLEYCPEDMTDEQRQRWSEAQQFADDE